MVCFVCFEPSDPFQRPAPVRPPARERGPRRRASQWWSRAVSGPFPPPQRAEGPPSAAMPPRRPILLPAPRGLEPGRPRVLSLHEGGSRADSISLFLRVGPLSHTTLTFYPTCRGKTCCHTCSNGLSGRCHTKNAVYNFFCCKKCSHDKKHYFYIGEISRPIRERFKEHLSGVRLRKLGTGLGEHVLDIHTNLSNKEINGNFLIEILSRYRDVADNKIYESIKIRDSNPNLGLVS